MEQQQEQQAFVLRISPGENRVDEALACNQIIIGWAEALGLLKENLSWDEFRGIVHDVYHCGEDNFRGSGAASGHLWRFIREMNAGDLVVVPHGSEFYVAEVSGAATHDASKVADDTAYRRNVKWLNEKNSIPRTLAKSALISRMKTRGTSAYATDLLPGIKRCIELSKAGAQPTFLGELQAKLVQDTLDEIQSGHMDSYGFEYLVHDVLLGLGAAEARVIARNQDEGADIVATFNVAGAFSQVLAVQAKHWQQTKPPVGEDVVEQLIKGIEAESADLGMIVTSGVVSEEATALAENYFEKEGVKIELVDGEQLAKLIVEHGIKTS